MSLVIFVLIVPTSVVARSKSGPIPHIPTFVDLRPGRRQSMLLLDAPQLSPPLRTMKNMQNNAQDSASRAWTRIPVLETAIVYLPDGRPTVGLLVDESFGGVRLMFRDAASIRAGSLVVGDTITVVYHRVPMQAVVRNRNIDEAEQLFVGLEWRE